MSDIVPGLSPEEVNSYESQRRRVRQTYGQGLAQNTYQRGVLDQNHSQALADLAKRYTQQRTRLPGAFISRGLGTSGIAKQGFQDYGQSYADAVARQQQAYGQQQGALNFGQLSNEQMYSTALQEIQDAQTARQQAIAAAMRGVY